MLDVPLLRADTPDGATRATILILVKLVFSAC